MRYFKFTADTNICGTEDVSYEEFENDVTEEQLNDWATDKAQENAESYEYLVIGWGNEEITEEEQEELDFYYENATCGWEEVSFEEYQENAE